MKRFKNILFVTNGIISSASALQRAVALANINDARLTIVDVIEEQDSPPHIHTEFGDDLNEILRDYRRKALEELVKPFNESDAIIYTKVLIGAPFIELIRSVQNNRYDLAIKTCQPPEGLSEHILGSTDMHLMRKCPCPVWIDRPGAATPYRRILAAVDPVDEKSNDCSRLIMDLATSLARRESADLAIVHAWRVYGESMLRSGRGRHSEEELEQHITQTQSNHADAFNELLSDYGLSTNEPEVYLTKGRPSTTIRNLSNDLKSDLIVMGTLGRTGIPGFFIGNTAEEVLQTTEASILAVKPAGFVSPVV